MTHVKQLRVLAAVAMLFVITVTLVVGLPIKTAFAAGNGTISISNATEGVTYNVYKILDMRYSGPDGEQATYTVPDDNQYKGIWEDMIGTYLVEENSGSLNSVRLNGEVYYLNITEDNVAVFAMAYARAIDAANVTATVSDTAESDTVEFSGLDIGYYLVVPDGGEMPVEGQAVPVNLTSTNPDAEIEAKGTTPSVTKTVDETDNSADVGDTVTYTITGTVPGYVDNDEITIYLHDKMNGLSLTGEYTLKINGSEANASLTTSNNGETATGTDATEVDGWLNDMKLPADGADEFTVGITGMSVGDVYEFSYSAVVDEDADRGADAANNNTVTAIFSHDPDGVINTDSGDTSDATTDEVPVYVFDVNIKKVIADTDEPLEGAKFVLYKESQGQKLYYFWNADEKKVEWKDISTSTPEEAAKAGTITSATSNSEGTCSFEGIQAGEYKLLEIEAPSGYNLLSDPVTVTFTTSSDDPASLSSAVVEVENSAGALLPGTGGMGTTLFYILGVCLMAGAAVVFMADLQSKCNKVKLTHRTSGKMGLNKEIQ